MSKDNLWTRQRKLQVSQDQLMVQIRTTFSGLSVELDNRDFRAAATSADLLTTKCIENVKLENELDDVNELVDSFDRINARMEVLEKQVMGDGLYTIENRVDQLESTLMEEGIGR